MRYATINEDGTFNAFITTRKNVLWDATHFCPASALTEDERTQFRVVEVADGTLPEPHPVTEYVVTHDPALVDGVWTVQYSVAERSITDVKAMLISQANSVRNEIMDGGITLSGLPISTDKGTKAELLGATKKPNPNRKRRVGGQTVLLTAQILEAMEGAVTAHTDATDSYHCDLCEVIEAAADIAALELIDVNAGWPSTEY